MANQIIEIDGAFGSGGGQILRTACALSVITKKPCHVFNIRQNRPKPGLMPQHLLGIQALSQLCSGSLEGDFLGSEEIKFYPGETARLQPSLRPPAFGRHLGPSSVKVKIETAGSITLVLQTMIPPALFAPTPIKISFDGGSTDTFFSPSVDHFRYCFLKILEKMGGKVEVNILRRGYYPEGGAKVEVKIFPSKPAPYRTTGSGAGLKNLNLLERGLFKNVSVISGASNSLREKKVAERQIAGVREILGKLKLPIEERVEYYDTQCPGSQICLIAEFENTVIAADNLGKLGKRAEDVGKEAALELLKEEKSGACLDKHLADQILPYLALARGKSQVTVSEITEHCKTNIWVIEKFIEGGFKINGNLISWQPNET